VLIEQAADRRRVGVVPASGECADCLGLGDRVQARISILRPVEDRPVIRSDLFLRVFGTLAKTFRARWTKQRRLDDWVTELPPIAKQPPRAWATQIAEDPWAEPVYISEPRPSASFSRRLFGRISVQFCSM
jgi:hypothetical protein